MSIRLFACMNYVIRNGILDVTEAFVFISAYDAEAII